MAQELPAASRSSEDAAPGVFEDFSYQAVLFWLDARHVIEPAYQAVLQELG